MRLVIDLQGAQTESRTRGIGRYSLALIQAILENRGEHDVIVTLNGAFTETIEPLATLLRRHLPRENIRVWEAPTPVAANLPGTALRRRRAEYVYEAFLESLAPDVVLITSLFEGHVDDAVTSIGRLSTPFPVALVLYDLIPLHDRARYLQPNPAFETFYKEKLAVLKKADLLLAISNFTAQDASQRLGIPKTHIKCIYAAATSIFEKKAIEDTDKSSLIAKIGIVDKFVVTSGTIDPHKNIARLLAAFARLQGRLLAKRQLVLIGKVNENQRRLLNEAVVAAGISPERVLITGYITDDELVALFNLCEAMVFPSLDEGFGLPALEAMSCGAVTIGSRAASVPEVVGIEEALFDPFDVDDIARSITRALEDEPFRARLREHARRHTATFSWERTAKAALSELEALVIRRRGQGKRIRDPMKKCIDALARYPAGEKETLLLAQHLARNFPDSKPRQLLVDVSELCQRDARTGCQRVTRSIALELLTNPPPDWRVELVYATADRLGYRYAKSYAATLLERTSSGSDSPVDFAPGDVFFGLDYQAHIVPAQEEFLHLMRRYGVRIHFLVYDLLSVTFPHFFMPGNETGFTRWLRTISKSDGIIGISRATADSFRDWQIRNGIASPPGFAYAHVHLGADIENSAPTRGVPESAPRVLSTLAARPTFLMVGTVEPRKGHAQALAAIEKLWADGADVNFAIVGKQGWNVEALAKRLRAHPERERRLFWLEGISDEYLDKIYVAADCLIAASEGEGFGLPLIEAARHGVPILARDIPVFREVAEGNAAYFSGCEAENLAAAIQEWIVAYGRGTHVSSRGMAWLTWRQCAQRMLAALGIELDENSANEHPKSIASSKLQG